VQVEHDLEPGRAGPGDGPVEHWQLALHVGISGQGRHGPVADGDADVVQAGGGHVGKVLLEVEGVPVRAQTFAGLGRAEDVREAVLVHDVAALGPGREERGRDPGLEEEPAAQVDATDLFVGVVEGDGLPPRRSHGRMDQGEAGQCEGGLEGHFAGSRVSRSMFTMFVVESASRDRDRDREACRDS
jgi:hypothetical protein